MLRPKASLKAKEGVMLGQNIYSINRGNGTAGMSWRPAHAARAKWLPK